VDWIAIGPPTEHSYAENHQEEASALATLGRTRARFASAIACRDRLVSAKAASTSVTQKFARRVPQRHARSLLTPTREDYAMSIPGFTAEASLYKTSAAFQSSQEPPRSMPQISPQLGFGRGGGIGVTYPPGDDDCYCCTSWVRCPCGLSIA